MTEDHVEKVTQLGEKQTQLKVKWTSDYSNAKDPFPAVRWLWPSARQVGASLNFLSLDPIIPPSHALTVVNHSRGVWRRQYYCMHFALPIERIGKVSS